MNRKDIKGWMLGILWAIGAVFLCPVRTNAGNIYTSPYVSFSPDRKAWTTNAGNRDYEWYENGTTVTTGIHSTLRQCGTGEHYYRYSRSGSVPVERWEVTWREAACIHSVPIYGWHGIYAGDQICGLPYFSGWNPYCADCGGKITIASFYMSKEAAASLQFIEAGTGLDYYYLCPSCNGLEQGVDIGAHTCTAISKNRYKIVYLANAEDECEGEMPDSFHMYDNEPWYHGMPVSYDTHLAPIRYEREGYVFGGWNTQADGTGRVFEDGEEIFNLTEADCDLSPEEGTVTLYAQWISYEEFLFTEKLSLSEGEHVYYSGQEEVYYVKGDGVTPFEIEFQAVLDVPPPLRKQIDIGILECNAEEMEGKEEIRLEDEILDCGEEEKPVGSGQIRCQWDGSRILDRGSSIFAGRSGDGRRIRIVGSYLIPQENAGRRITIIPRAGMGLTTKTIYSDRELDMQNGITIIGDRKAPEIFGMDILKALDLIDRDEISVITDFSAEDDLSGVTELRVEIQNLDNQQTETFEPDDTGHIRIEMTREEPLFTGDFVIRITAADHVGNEQTYTFGTTEFALHAQVEKLLDPEDTVFKRGESGILSISTWGYAEKVEVEFPPEIAENIPHQERIFLYGDDAEYRKDEKIRFMIPLYMEEGEEYEITVRAWKGDKKLEDHPRIRILMVEGTVLDDLRSRLR